MATATDTIREIFDAVEIPPTLSERHVKIAQSYAMNQLKEKKAIAEWCKDNELSTKSFYAWKKGVKGFESYINNLLNDSVDDDLKTALSAMDKHVLKLAHQNSVTPAEIKIFTEYFGFAIEARKRQYLKDNGLDESGSKQQVSIEERRNSLLAKLGGNK